MKVHRHVTGGSNRIKPAYPETQSTYKIAMTGSTQSPSLGLTSLFDADEVNHRIDAALKYLAN